MLRAVIASLAVVAGCYADPDLGATRFRCDDAHACPAGQACVDGVCSADPGDGGDDAGVEAEVTCGAGGCGVGEEFCADFVAGPRCQLAAAGCTGIAATCDGLEDCALGSTCCDLGGGVVGCAPACQNQICREPADCTNPGAPACCFGIGTDEPWGRCLAACP
jgi:hypothetical protein